MIRYNQGFQKQYVKKDFYAKKNNNMSPINFVKKNESMIIIEYVPKKPKLSGTPTERTFFYRSIDRL